MPRGKINLGIWTGRYSPGGSRGGQTGYPAGFVIPEGAFCAFLRGGVVDAIYYFFYCWLRPLYRWQCSQAVGCSGKRWVGRQQASRDNRLFAGFRRCCSAFARRSVRTSPPAKAAIGTSSNVTLRLSSVALVAVTSPYTTVIRLRHAERARPGQCS